MCAWTKGLVSLVLGFVLLTGACEADEGRQHDGGEGRRHVATGQVTLGFEDGFVLAGETLVAHPAANIRNIDLIAFGNLNSLELRAGDPEGGMHVPKLGGRPVRYASLADVPRDEPSYGARDKLPSPETGWAFALRGNVSDGVAWFRVVEGVDSEAAQNAPHPQLIRLTLEYEAIWFE
jgi:hypothetical protein